MSAHKIIFDLIAPFCYELWAERNSVFLELIDQTNLVAIFSVEILIQLSREKKNFQKTPTKQNDACFLTLQNTFFHKKAKGHDHSRLWIFNSFFKTKNRPETLQVPIFKYPL